MTTSGSFDSLSPHQMAIKAEDVGVAKGNHELLRVFLLSLLGGAYIAMGSVFCTTVMTGMDASPYGLQRFMGGIAFSLGLILVVVGGAELFTGNVLLVMATASRKLPWSKLLMNWFVVYVGNFIASVLTAYLIFLAQQYTSSEGAVGILAMKTATAKSALAFTPALVRGIYCNALVCLGVWLCYSCRSTTDKILAIVFPITAFVAAGFEHCVANMYLIPVGLFVKSDVAFWASKGVDLTSYASLTWSNFLMTNLIPVTLGNIIGGGLFVGGIYWMIYLRPAKHST